MRCMLLALLCVVCVGCVPRVLSDDQAQVAAEVKEGALALEVALNAEGVNEETRRRLAQSVCDNLQALFTHLDLPSAKASASDLVKELFIQPAIDGTPPLTPATDTYEKEAKQSRENPPAGSSLWLWVTGGLTAAALVVLRAKHGTGAAIAGLAAHMLPPYLGGPVAAVTKWCLDAGQKEKPEKDPVAQTWTGMGSDIA